MISMGLFGLFKKHSLLHDEKVDIAYGCFKESMVEMIFPGKKEQADNIIVSLAKIYEVNLKQCDAKKYYDILSTYTHVVIREVITHSGDKKIMESLQFEHSDLVKSEEVAKKVLAYVTINMVNHSFRLDTENDMEMLMLIVDTRTQAEQNAAKNDENETKDLEDPEYGLVVNKPIYTQGVSGSKKYLESLKTASGEQLTWIRHGSTSVDNIHGMIDIYESFFLSGEPYKILYLNMYGTTNSTQIPVGFSK